MGKPSDINNFIVTKPVMSVLRAVVTLETCTVPEVSRLIRRPANTVYGITKRLKLAGFITSTCRPCYEPTPKGKQLVSAMEGLLL